MHISAIWSTELYDLGNDVTNVIIIC